MIDTCIYCQEEKSRDHFNREHVLPRSFGTFNQNLVLNSVCKECNSYFADNLELKMARDSFEGMMRFVIGGKSTKEFRRYGSKATTNVSVRSRTNERGMWLRLVPKSDGRGFEVEFEEQIGFADKRDCPETWYLADALPSRSEVAKRLGVDRSSLFRISLLGADHQRLKDKLREAGFLEFKDDGEMQLPFGETLPVEHEFRMGDPEFRTLAKILLNYLALVLGSDFVGKSRFDVIRRYIRYGVRPKSPPIWPGPEICDPRLPQDRPFHYLGVNSTGGVTVGQITLFGVQRYGLLLSSLPTSFSVEFESGHLFDIGEREIKPIKGIRPPKRTPLPAEIIIESDSVFP
jgi:hypothetical protein